MSNIEDVKIPSIADLIIKIEQLELRVKELETKNPIQTTDTNKLAKEKIEQPKAKQLEPGYGKYLKEKIEKRKDKKINIVQFMKDIQTAWEKESDTVKKQYNDMVLTKKKVEPINVETHRTEK